MYLTITMTKQFFRFQKFSTFKNDLIGPTKANNHEWFWLTHFANLVGKLYGTFANKKNINCKNACKVIKF